MKHWIAPLFAFFAIAVSIALVVWLAKTRPCVPSSCRPTWASDCRCIHSEHRIEWRGENMLCMCEEQDDTR